ncbi:MAG: threonylcarbamoyl-AMP synthase [Bacteroidaceae bacterium]|nr:threonylcarbamoyl-AMP synthase [Bacteroidaceae bacterium]MBP5323180.1 threonylcarbamoyl-AMP synthase [Bacteroidaceae bacterium]
MIQKLFERDNNPRIIEQIAEVLNDGGIIIYPTDTTYAIGCHALKERAIERICQIKGLDPRKHRFSIVFPDMSTISEYVKVDNATFKLMRRNLPGPFTFILPAGSRLPKIFRNRKEVGIRIPDNSITMAICQSIDAPLLSTTLPYNEDDDIEYLTDPELIDERYGDLVDIVIDGGYGGTQSSTVVDCVSGEHEIIRQGLGELIE